MITRQLSIIAAILGAFFVCGASFAIFISSTQKQAVPSDLSSLTEQGDEINLCVSCGSDAMFVALSRIGDGVSPTTLDQNIVLNANGASMGELVRLANERGYETSLGVIPWEDLLKHRGTAILWVNGDHFVTADPREQEPGEPAGGKRESLRIYDTATPARWWTRQQLEEAWTGETLLIHTLEEDRVSEAPLVWSERLLDTGFMSSQKTASYSFAYRNTSDTPASVEVVKIGCGCSSAAVQETHIEPGGTGVLDVDVELMGKRGFYQTYIVVGVKSPEGEWTDVLRVRGGAQYDSITSVDKLHVGVIHKGERVTKPIYIYNSYGEKMDILSTLFEFTHLIYQNKSIKANAEYARIDSASGSLNATQKIAVREGDYRVDVTLTPLNDCALGRFKGRLIVTTNLSEPHQKIQIPIEGVVRSSVVASPQALMLDLEEGASDTEIEVRLKSQTGSELTVTGTELISKDLEIDDRGVEVVSLDGGTVLKMNVVIASNNKTAAGGELVVEFNESESIRIPIAIMGARP